jgi:hypothetical protein
MTTPTDHWQKKTRRVVAIWLWQGKTFKGALGTIEPSGLSIARNSKQQVSAQKNRVARKLDIISVISTSLTQGLNFALLLLGFCGPFNHTWPYFS